MARGRPRKPTALKLLAGEQPCRLNPDEPQPAPGRPDPPAHLDGEARAEWERIAPRLESMGVLTQADGPALAIYCVAYARWGAARQAIAEGGLFIDTTRVKGPDGVEVFNPKGCVKANPAVAVAAACETTMTRVLASFGADPSSRSRVKAVRPEPRDALAEFLSECKLNRPDS